MIEVEINGFNDWESGEGPEESNGLRTRGGRWVYVMGY